MKTLFNSLAITALFLAAFTPAATAQQTEYQIGQGLSVREWLTLGGYFSTEFEDTDDDTLFAVDDLAVLVYGEFANRFSYLLELESVGAYSRDFEADTEEFNLPPTIERLYVDYKLSDQLAIRVGKQIVPIGYWNLQPINVLRETTSNPSYSRLMFPKFLTGIDVYGYAPFDNSLTYHVYAQDSRDMDQNNINLLVDRHFGLSLEKLLSGGWRAGGSTGRYREAVSETQYLQLNTRYDSDRFTLLAEGIVNFLDPASGADYRSRSAYLQGEFRVHVKHGIIGRLEYLDDDSSVRSNHTTIIGYSYRPVFPVSLKIEYQWHRESRDNGLLASFSVLF